MGKVKTIVIVDDEPIIREGIQYLIDWEEYGYKVVATAENGKRGLIAIEQHRPDLILTDIRMPEMTGLEMIQEAKKINAYSFHAIILSGFSEFEYAQKAIALGFTNYLLKPVDEEELISILKELQNQSTLLEQEQLQKLIFDKLFSGDKSPIQDYTWLNCSCFYQDIPQSILHQLNNQSCQYITFQNIGRHYLVWLDNREQTRLQAHFMEIFRQQGLVISTGWVSAKQDLTKLQAILDELSEFAFLRPDDLIYPDSQFLKHRLSPKAIVDFDSIVHHIMSGQELVTVLQRYLQTRVIHFTSKQSFIWQIQDDVKLVVDMLLKKIQKPFVFEMDTFYSSIKNVQSYQELADLMLEKFKEISYTVGLELGNVDFIDQLLYYVDQHYQEELTLKDVADHFGYNSAYLGKKFKKKMAEPFLNYLERVRMQKTADLLIHSRLMVYEIADQVGYKNIDYFYKKFKHFYGVTPNEYRKIHT
ncbi:response regulator transcription factor [Streptococcus suis]|uniref:response regulator n=1 Tax=Streptococcus suis TaxID=1307 RepID=UPI0019228BC8|nr:response regulator [Streptococcus suis]MBL1125066.1 response regulator transcription factor [Streptococcus suis]